MTSGDATRGRLYRFRWPLRILLALLVPALLLGGLELVLRLSGFGYDWRLFVPIKGTDLVASNPEFGYRFFPRAVARKPLLSSFPAEKSAGTYRIFILGASAAAGVPNSTFSFAQILDVMLERQYPDIDFQMVNMSMPAINSHVVAPIAEECARFNPDLFLVYLGNNEVIGPFSSGSADQRRLATASVIRTTVNLRKTRIGQLIQSMGQGIGKDANLEEWGGMAQYAENFLPEGDPVLDQVYANFRANLERVIEVAGNSGARTLLSTVSVNVADNAPFASLHPADWTASDEDRWSRIYSRAGAIADEGSCEEAAKLFRESLSLDDQHAETHFRLARCQARSGDLDSAETHFRRALDLDALRFRSGTGINRVIRETATAHRDGNVHLVDTEKLITDLSRRNGTLPGKELFYEHVHFRFLGNYLVARAMLDAVEAGLPSAIRAGASRAEIPTPADCARILAWTPFNQYRMLSDIYMMVRANPFTNQYDQPETQAGIESEMARLREPANIPDPMELVRAYQQALDGRPEDLLLRFNYAIMVAELGDPVEANRQLDILRARVPEGSLPDDLVKTNPGRRKVNQGITRSGFSLVAVIIFLGVAAVLIGVLVPMAYRGAMEARERETRQELLDLNRGLTLYYADVGRFPADSEGFGALNTDPGVAGWQGPYLAGNRESPLDEALSDAWGLPYVYDLNPTTTPPSIGEVIVVSGGIDRSVTVGSQGGIWQLDDPDTDDLWTLVSSLGVEQDNLMEVNRELEKVAAAAQIFFRDRRTYPDLVGDLLDDFLAGGVADRRTRDSWNTTYRLIPDNAANPPTLTILSSGSDRIDENGTGDDLSLTINSVVPGRRSTVYKLKLAQAIVDGDSSFAMSGDWPTDRINLNLDPVLDADGWQTPFEEKVSTRQVLSAGPDADYWTPEDNIPQIVPDDGGVPEGLVLVDGSIEMPKKNCYHIRFDMTNTTDAPITISEATITWAAPEAYYDRVEIGGTRVIWEKKNRVSSGQTKTFSQTITINPGQTVQVDIRDYFQGLNGPQKQNMGGIVVGVEFDDGTVITLQTPTCS